MAFHERQDAPDPFPGSPPALPGGVQGQRHRSSTFPPSISGSPAPAQQARIFSSAAANPVGPAAGPHTQLAQNIIAAWLAGGRYFELKTVQKLDALVIDKPCIDAADEGYNVEWSTELSLDQAYDEYLKAWMPCTSSRRSSGQAPGSFLFNMSVGYDLDGIRTEKMDRFIGRLMDSSREPLFDRYREELAQLAADPGLLKGTPWQAMRRSGPRSSRRASRPGICASVTLSTMHGCPPGEIESICSYMLKEKKLDTLVKLNPTLLGYERARRDPVRARVRLRGAEAGGLPEGPAVLGRGPHAHPAARPRPGRGTAFRGQALQHPRRGERRGACCRARRCTCRAGRCTR